MREHYYKLRVADIAAIKARLSSPSEVAAMLGLKGKRIRGGVLVACPVHRNRSGSLGLRSGRDGTIKIKCFGCDLFGDVIDLLSALEGSFERGLARAEQLAGGASAAPHQPVPEPERVAPELYHELADAILEAGRLDGRREVREVEEYLASRRLLSLARSDDWACLPPLRVLLAIAGEVCHKGRRGESMAAVLVPGFDSRRRVDKASDCLGAFAFGPQELLVAAKLAKYDKERRFVASWGPWRLVIPWRGPDGRISALQRRRTWIWTPREGDAEPAKYVFPWAPEWPYGAHRAPVGGKLLIVEGAVDTLAARALGRGRVDVLGLPGIGGWRESWAALAEGRKVLVGLDRGKPRPDGLVNEDLAAARIALDCVGRGHERDAIIEAMKDRHRRGQAMACVLCGAAEPWLCRGCGRRFSSGKDWGEDWSSGALQ